jgi:anti-sigma regulatory factor (Ser/Thr protein kinase)
VHTTDEVGQLARAVDEIHEQALNLAAEQARLRLQIGNMFETLSRRSQSLVEQQLALIEDLEHDEDNGERLQSLFRLDHLATRMRRNGDNLLVLAGTALRRGQLHPVPLSDMLWSAVSQVEDYQRVEIGAVPDGIVAGEPAVDIEHLLAELIDNALRYSPPTTPVAVMVARAVDGGYLIEITDRGLGMSLEDLQATNDRLASGGEVTVETARRMGLFVVGRLAKRHTITVSLRRTSTMAQQPGITASVHLPGVLVAPSMDPEPTQKGLEPPTTPTLPAAPAQQPRTLVPVPSLPQREPARFTSSGLPQRRAAIRVADTAEQPAVAEPEADDAEPLPDMFAEHPIEAPDLDLPRVAPFSPPTSASNRSTGPSNVSSVDEDTQAWPVFDTGTFAAIGESTPATDIEPQVPLGANVDTWTEDNAGSWSEEDADTWDEDDALVSTGAVSSDPQATTSAPDPTGGKEPVTVSAGARPSPAEKPATTPDSGPATSSRLQPVAGETPTPIYQRMVSEWLVEPATTTQHSDAAWSSPAADAGWLAAEDAARPTTTSRTSGGLPIRRPGAQLVPGGLVPDEDAAARDPDEIRSSLTRHLSGVRSGRADAQYNDGGLG